MILSDDQERVATLLFDRRVFLEGPAGAGKTTAGVARLQTLLESGVPGGQILIWTPQRSLGEPYFRVLSRPESPAGIAVSLLTLGGLARRGVDLYWPLIAAPAGFAQPDRPPTYLTLETAQYFMARVVEPLFAEGCFDSLLLDRNRLYSQILDNLNKAAAVGFPFGEIATRLRSAWAGDSAQLRVYDDAALAAERFRAYCLAHNLLDFSLQLETYRHYVLSLPGYRSDLLARSRHLIVDNVEEDPPVAHDILLDLLAEAESALVIYDEGGGHRRFLGADPASAYRLREGCHKTIALRRSFVMSSDLAALVDAMASELKPRPYVPLIAPVLGRGAGRRVGEELDYAGLGGTSAPAEEGRAGQAFTFNAERYYPEMLGRVARDVAELIHEQGIAPGEIAILAPYLGGNLRFSLGTRLETLGVPVRSHRPSRALVEEPAVRCMLALAALCHPEWGVYPDRYEVGSALSMAVADLDPVRAALLAQVSYRASHGVPSLNPFANLGPEMQERITFTLGARYEGLREWMAVFTQAGDRPALDHFFGRLFGEVLSQPGYGFHDNIDAGGMAAILIESARRFRHAMRDAAVAEQATGNASGSPGETWGRIYYRLVREGVVAAQYLHSWRRLAEEAVLLTPAYTFLMSGREASHQFWLDVGSTAWWERLHQPLTQPYVLARTWDAGKQWTDADEYRTRQEAILALAQGLLRRCRTHVHLYAAELGVEGVERQGPLLRAAGQIVRRTARAPERDGGAP